MPHIHLITSADLVENVDIPDILGKLVHELGAFESVRPRRIKAYHTLHNNWSMGEGAPPGFVHCQVLIKAGRTPELIESIREVLFATLVECFGKSYGEKEAAISLEVRELSENGYVSVLPIGLDGD
ncbi:MAG: hypothetical protein HND43_00370 [Armatimonadetes bacterium]|uniref:5-carboxymethyl-2-hydroxymuconate isomerase n=1 Tax=Candidatus Nitrosymbiomonas proteolyticus TaxID=2608984 RepID=A0A809S3X3_9BACT|nr:MAG: hypothetical protein EDM74_07590 [Armatimonadota bacterium]KXK17428.1 MAG: 5-carboxymethyl-2-hydroxymuconate isomerase [Armatimonadetes bacterium OLB18]MCK6631555.1 hypothetical protein [Fimbriimonadaceae bacterium]BBO23276.1 5-carboxymethyl-2-hydroxymuconate isomerase [Candidatus Nitrosymbiomonas proteolyticus]MBL1151179.1 hypothetical protein [Armatimonadota bacterium]